MISDPSHSEETWFSSNQAAYGGQESYQQRFDNFRDAMTKWFNETTRAFTTPETKYFIEDLAKQHGVNIEVSLDATNQLNINMLPETPIVVTLTRPSFDLQVSKSDKYDSMSRKLVERYGPKLGQFLTNRLASMIRKRKAECLSHLRICKIGDPVSEGVYDDIEDDGCCGSYSETFEFKHKIFGMVTHTSKYKIGFNYGH
jgi:hypothetical protein